MVLLLMIVEDHQSPRVLTSLLHPEQADSFKIINAFVNQALAIGTTTTSIDSMNVVLGKMGLNLRTSPIGPSIFYNCAPSGQHHFKNGGANSISGL